MKNLWNRIPENHRGLAFLLASTIPLAGLIAAALPSPEQVALENTAAREQAELVAQATAAQEAEDQARQERINAYNRVRSECWKYARQSAIDPGSVDGPEGWINGDVTSDFVVIQPFTAKNGFGVRFSATAVCSGNGGVITSFEIDQR